MKTPLLCVIDEVLRGTNTTERIAASERCCRLRRANVPVLQQHMILNWSYLLEDLYTNYHLKTDYRAEYSFLHRLEQAIRGKNAIALRKYGN